ncbi:hypothetical protein [Legionella clemsonensis]|uniref:Uncharacterized protein n=1 Tax=Legionella clemsonensis TaxID=1867846 RepID=A0A222P663_9GAMM|nr:hypothetical protein [Legionella clemsonensis]ASQ47322.1 hypothetical protein clem_13980 [Legionella clemsonensis]
MLRHCIFFVMVFIASMSLAKSCTIDRSCLKLYNQYPQIASIKCNGLSNVSATTHTLASVQLDLAYGDGLGAPEPRTIYCKLDYAAEQPTREFNFYNPYWGSVLEFTLIAEKKLEVRVINGWGSRNETHYTFSW